MRIGLLQCDDVAEELQPRHGNYPDMFERLMTSADPTLSFRTWRCHDGDIPSDTMAVDAWLITGSKFGVNDGSDWIDRLCSFVRELWRTGRPLVGVCFGHQLIAKALGGEVVKNERGWGVGMSFNRVTERAAWMEPWQEGLDLVVSHQDQVRQLPEGAKILAVSDFCPIYLMQVGETFLGVQGHPEFTKAYSADLMEFKRDILPGNRLREGMTSLSAPVDDQVVVRWMLNFLDQALHQSVAS
ncbi:type 1 glutamine amidotransferase [Modicisalibacter xianhensis]|uniref:GMP synthase-Glutamine amidotransferase n=1 Tax=Modicisalibacter xianhensis TaxID=442341 RepID=A0A1I2YMF8_9GAMM|nr:gamma-glutamyl-gamma-aminobutyrate hydrolase family protein [Halomonas xianhensis]SFH26803.1 GMP synthase-Glutamine amidotransferase [Halomonas xianhensis]